MKGRNPSRPADGADWPTPRCGAMLERCTFEGPMFPRSELTGPEGRVLLLFGGVNGRNPPRFPPCVVEDGLLVLLLTGVFVCCRLENVPGIARCIVLRVATAPPVMRAPAEIPFTWFCCIVCCRRAVCCWNEAGRATLLCTDPKKRSEPPLRTVEGAAARPLADRLARDGTTGRLPAIMRAPFNCWRVTGDAVTRPAPKRPAPTVDMARNT